MNKNEIRRHIKTLKNSLTDTMRADALRSVSSKLETWTPFLKAESILIYHSLSDEFPTHELIERWCVEKTIYLPIVDGVNLKIAPYIPGVMRQGEYGIMEPISENYIDIDSIEMVIIPAIAVDTEGNRLGRGKGFYDRLLKDCNAIKVVIGYDFQIINKIPTEKHDIPVDYVITENRLIIRKK